MFYPPRLTHLLAVYFLLMSVSLISKADNFGVEEIKHLTPKDLDLLESPQIYEDLEKLYGPSTRADSYAIGWPKAIHGNLGSREKWRRAYWFFYKMNERGRPIYPITLDFVASLPENAQDIDKSWMSLLPQMIVDWPEEKAGKKFEDMFQASEDDLSEDKD